VLDLEPVVVDEFEVRQQALADGFDDRCGTRGSAAGNRGGL